jgi:hypothetical protein
MGRTIEDVESRALREHYDVYYSRLKDVGGLEIDHLPVQAAAREQ